MKTAIMTDSNSGIMEDEARSLGIYSIPMPVIIEDEIYYEGKNLNLEDFYTNLEQGKNVTTSQPSPGDVMDIWDDALSKYDEVVYIPMSSGLSHSCQMATGIAQEYEGKVQVINNHRISVTQRQSVMDAITLSKSGKSAKEIKEILEQDAYNSSIYIAVDTLEYLKKSGRVTPAGAALGAVLKIKPILTIQGERLDAFAKVRGIKSCVKKILDAVENDRNERFKDTKNEDLIIGAAGSFKKKEDADNWLNDVKEKFPDIEVYYNHLSFSIGSHTGPEAIGIGISKKIK